MDPQQTQDLHDSSREPSQKAPHTLYISIQRLLFQVVLQCDYLARFVILPVLYFFSQGLKHHWWGVFPVNSNNIIKIAILDYEKKLKARFLLDQKARGSVNYIGSQASPY